MRTALIQLELLLSCPAARRVRDFQTLSKMAMVSAFFENPALVVKVQVITSAVEYISCMQRRLLEVQQELVSRGEK